MSRWRAAALIGSLVVAGCQSGPPSTACPPGQEKLRTAQMFFGRNVASKPTVTDADFRAFLDQEVTPRFPDGLTVMDGGGQWRGSENQLIREAAKVVLIVLPRAGSGPKLDAVRAAYKKRFGQESVLLITQAACVSF